MDKFVSFYTCYMCPGCTWCDVLVYMFASSRELSPSNINVSSFHPHCKASRYPNIINISYIYILQGTRKLLFQTLGQCVLLVRICEDYKLGCLTWQLTDCLPVRHHRLYRLSHSPNSPRSASHARHIKLHILKTFDGYVWRTLLIYLIPHQ